jgi:hypothetical protein
MHSVMISTPTNGTVKTGYMKSVIGTMADLAKRGISSAFLTEEGSHLAYQRNVLADRFLKSAATHIFFVDSDILLSPNLCSQMLTNDKPIIGAVYPQKTLNLNRIETALKSGLSIREAFPLGFTWVTHFGNHSCESLDVRQVELMGLGAVLIKRSALELMISNSAARQDTAAGMYNFFGERPQNVMAERPSLRGEDFSFYQRWTIDCGQKLYALINAEISHLGDFGYGGNYSEALSANARIRP